MAVWLWHVGRHPESHKQVCRVTIVALFSVKRSREEGRRIVAMMLRVRLCSSDFDL